MPRTPNLALKSLRNQLSLHKYILIDFAIFICNLNKLLNFSYPFWNNNFQVLIISYLNKKNSTIQTNAFFLLITINNIFEFFNIFIPTSTITGQTEKNR